MGLEYIYIKRIFFFLFFFNDPATTEIYTLSLPDALPICRPPQELFFMLAIVEENTTAMVLGGSRIVTSGQDLLHYQLRGRSDLLT